MVLLTLSKKVNQYLGPFLLKTGIKLRFSLAGGVIRDNPWLDAALFIPLAQRLVSVEVHEESQQAIQGGGSSLWSSFPTFSNDDKKNESSPMRSLEEESALRVQVLEKYLRPALAGSNEKWSSVRCWQFHDRFLKWARTEFLVAKHGPAVRVALQAFPTLRDSPQLMGGKRQFRTTSNTDDDTKKDQLPTSASIQMAFSMKDWASTKRINAVHKDMERIATKLGGEIISLRGGGLRFASIPADADISGLTMEEILEVAGGYVASCGPFNALCEQADIYQLWSKEYVERLGDYLCQRIQAYADGETIILDVGAGDGLLIDALREHYEKRETNAQGRKQQAPNDDSSASPPLPPHFVATDNGSWSISVKAPVENLSVEQAMEIYADEPNRQIIVLCSWMPMDDDWSRLFRQVRVEEYILIGECDDGQCGENWLTWGNPMYRSDGELMGNEIAQSLFQDEEQDANTSVSSAPPSAVPPLDDVQPQYKVDHYQRRDMDALLPHQFSRFDSRVSKTAKTISFRRIDDC